MADRPLIGVSTGSTAVPIPEGHLDAYYVGRAYVRMLERVGADAVLLPAVEGVEEEAAERYLDRVSGIMLPGGIDVAPGFYGGDWGPIQAPDHPRDTFEAALVRGAIDRGLPLLGVCRGMQMLNVACGGTIDQHVPDRLGGDVLHREVPGTYSEHGVEIIAGTLAARAVGGEQARVKSHHHQAVERLGEGLAISGYSATDRIVEAIELPGKRYALGVLWHPEEDMYSNVIGSLVEAARQEVNG